jgi:hypothetical protein
VNDAADIDPAAGIRVQVAELTSTADALFFEEEDGQPVLLIRRRQSFASAVESVRDAMEIPEDRARDIVRVYHPEAAEWGEQDVTSLIAEHPEFPGRLSRKPPTEPDGRPARHLRLLPRWTVTAIAAVAALGAGYGMAGHQAAPLSSPDATDGIELSDAEPYSSAAFKSFATDGEMACTPTGPLEAKCVDIDGKVMYSEASVGSDWTQFSFTYDEGDNRIGLRVFSNEAAARLWVQEDGSRESVNNLVQYGRYALWGSDEERLREYLGLLQDQDEPSSVLAPQAAGRHAGKTERVTTAAAKQAQPKPHNAKHAKAKKTSTTQSNTATPTNITTGHQTVWNGYATNTVQTSPMPRRLAVLALGTLGIDPANPPTLAKANTLQEMGALVAVSIVMGVDPADTGVPVGEVPSLPLSNAEWALAEGTTSVSDERLALAFVTETAPIYPETAETATSVEPSSSTTPPATSTDQTQKPTEDQPSTTPTVPEQPESPTTTVPEEPTEVTPTPEGTVEETPASTSEPDEADPSAPTEEPVIEDPSAGADDSVDEDQAVDVQDDTVTAPPEDETAPVSVEEPDTEAELVTIPDAWRGDQAA